MQKDTLEYKDALNKLKSKKLFKDMDISILEKIVSECELDTIKKSKTIDYDMTLKYLYIILEGRLKITQIDPNSGRSLTLFILSDGDIFDIFTLLDEREHVVFPIAMDDIKALRVPLKRAREWVCQNPEFNRVLFPYLGEILRRLEEFSQDMVFYDTTTRLAKLILRHATPKEGKNHYPLKLIHNLSHEALAEMIGSVRSVVSLQMQKLKEEEVILSKRGHLAIKNLEKLIEKAKNIEECLIEKISNNRDSNQSQQKETK